MVSNIQSTQIKYIFFNALSNTYVSLYSTEKATKKKIVIFFSYVCALLLNHVWLFATHGL